MHTNTLSHTQCDGIWPTNCFLCTITCLLLEIISSNLQHPLCSITAHTHTHTSCLRVCLICFTAMLPHRWSPQFKYKTSYTNTVSLGVMSDCLKSVMRNCLMCWIHASLHPPLPPPQSLIVSALQTHTYTHSGIKTCCWRWDKITVETCL